MQPEYILIVMFVIREAYQFSKGYASDTLKTVKRLEREVLLLQCDLAEASEKIDSLRGLPPKERKYRR